MVLGLRKEKYVKPYAFNKSSSSFIQDVDYYKTGVKYFSRRDEGDMACQMLLGLGDSYLHEKNFKKAWNSYNVACKIYQDEHNLRGELQAREHMGHLHEQRQDWALALENYTRAWHLLKNLNDPRKERELSQKIGDIYKKEGSYDDSLRYYKESLTAVVDAPTRSKYDELKNKVAHLHPSKFQGFFLVFLIIIIFLAEILTTYGDMRLGLVTHFMILIGLIVGAGLSNSRSYSNLLRCLIVLPLIRIIGLSMPIMQIDPLYWFPIVALPLLAAAFILMRSQGLTRESVGIMVDNIYIQLLIPFTGIIFGITEYIILQPEPLLGSLNIVDLFVGSVVIIIATGFAEELLYRGLIQKNAENVMGKYYALLFASLLFTALHMGWTSNLDLIFVFLVALFYGYIFQKTRSIIGISLSHGISNILLFLVLPLLL